MVIYAYKRSWTSTIVYKRLWTPTNVLRTSTNVYNRLWTSLIMCVCTPACVWRILAKWESSPTLLRTLSTGRNVFVVTATVHMVGVTATDVITVVTASTIAVTGAADVCIVVDWASTNLLIVLREGRNHI